jgi:hypothetical protein
MAIGDLCSHPFASGVIDVRGFYRAKAFPSAHFKKARTASEPLPEGFGYLPGRARGIALP